MQIYTGESLAEQLTDWGVPCEFLSRNIAPQLVKYYFNLLQIGKLQKLKKMTEELALATDTEIKLKINEGKQGDFSLELLRDECDIVKIGQFANILSSAKPYTIALGIDENGEKRTATLDDVTHMLVSGTTGSGKSVMLHDIIMSLCCYNQTKDFGLVLVDAKQVEFNCYARLPHLMCPIIDDVETAKGIFLALVQEMNKRYAQMKKLGIEKNCGQFKKILVVVDELADLVMADEEIKKPLIQLLQKARACGIHLCLSTQSPRAKLLDGLMLANLPTRIALTSANVRESMLVLGHKGAETLLGKGDCLVKLPSSTKEFRVQTPLITLQQIKSLIK